LFGRFRVIVRETHRAVQFGIIQMRVAFDHSQRRPAANHLHRAQ
jgi:hypothetical protein